MGMFYVCLTENNDWEGEVWRFYIPVEGNEAAIEKLRAIIESAVEEAGPNPSADDEIPYSVSIRTYTEAEVDLLCEDVEDGYFASHNKTEGITLLPSDRFAVDDLYKFGLRKHGLNFAHESNDGDN